MTFRIKLSGNKNKEAHQQFLEGIFADTDELELGRNPFNLDQITVVDKSGSGSPVGMIQLQYRGDRIRLSSIEIGKDYLGRGLGSAVLDFLCRHADEHELEIEAGVSLYKPEDESGLSLEELEAWYLRRGFEFRGSGVSREIIRTPQPRPTLTP